MLRSRHFFGRLRLSAPVNKKIGSSSGSTPKVAALVYVANVIFTEGGLGYTVFIVGGLGSNLQ